MTANEPMVEASGIGKTFTLPAQSLFGEAKRVAAVVDVSFRIPHGRTFGLVGESGSGKSTIAKMLLKLEAPTEGDLRVEGQPIFRQSPAEELAYRRKVQAVFQDPYGSLSPRMRADRIVSEPLRAHGMPRREAEARAPDLLRIVGLPPEAALKYPHEFSGGQRQRLAIARALSVDPQLLVLDEPVSALDVSVRAQVLALLRDMQQRLGLTYLFIGHDLAVVRYLSDIVGVMYFGRVVEVGPARQVLRQPFHPYTRRLVALASGDAPLGAVRMQGELPSPLNPPSGCLFRTRCTYADTTCIDQRPEMRDAGSEHMVACHHYEAVVAGTKAETGPQLREA
ncbi:ABC transporter ATP-binding protein [Neoroseomonas soli]|uniref:ATP-binding cassette domain-containing protein n=1 Tax=Neoroseomonas soli TaxID=1081025 RepID=A0A9X9WTK2_9PROT|nr:oligopeptide/dipeptide ABC transporter ATP-binding protein [Neoroseomonas soli]MBR0670481.1 ATP-binding cassette domain-containing protein [Neoroseomonas soli]